VAERVDRHLPPPPPPPPARACHRPQALQQEFGPLEAYDAQALPYPAHHLPGAKLKGFPMKPYALLHSK
jgi:hypothetical protein